MTALPALAKARRDGSSDIERETKSIEQALEGKVETSGLSREDPRKIDAQTNPVIRSLAELCAPAAGSDSEFRLLNREIAASKTERVEGRQTGRVMGEDSGIG